MPDESEVLGLLALMLLQDSRRAARSGPGGELVLLDDQDRSLGTGQIEEGRRVSVRALSMRKAGPYQLQAAIAAVHSEARAPAEKTDWPQIAALYGELARGFPPRVELNRAVAVSLADGPAEGHELVERIEGLDHYPCCDATRGARAPGARGRGARSLRTRARARLE